VNTYAFETINLVKDRAKYVPADVPADALIFNAPRPIAGTTTWKGDWLSGTFYAAVNADDPWREDWIKANRSDHAMLVYFVDEETAKAAVREASGRYTDKYTPEMFEKHWRESYRSSFGKGAEVIECGEQEPLVVDEALEKRRAIYDAMFKLLDKIMRVANDTLWADTERTAHEALLEDIIERFDPALLPDYQKRMEDADENGEPVRRI